VIGLQNNYEMDNFEKLQQDTLIALVACCPKRAVPWVISELVMVRANSRSHRTIIEQFFTNQYSVAHRHSMLNALALGARELADLPTPPQPEARFPSKLLPSGAHELYIEERDLVARSEQLLEGISRKAIDKGREKTEDRIPELTRERQLTIKPGIKRTGIVELDNDPKSTDYLHRPIPRTPTSSVKRENFSTLAAEYFIGPLINRFWRYLNDQMTREARASGGYRGAGGGVILNPLILTHLVTVLAILMDAGRFSPAYLDVLGPGALELSITLGTRKLSATEGADSGSANGSQSAKEASVLRACLQLALIVCDACLDLDGGRTLAFDQTTLLLGLGEWSESVFKAMEAGAKVIGGGGREEDRLLKSAAGLVLKVEEIRNKWKGRMTVSL
jgi:telomere length regulation protein